MKAEILGAYTFKIPKTVQNPSKALKTLGAGPYTGRDVRVGFSEPRRFPQNVADFLKTLINVPDFLKTP